LAHPMAAILRLALHGRIPPAVDVEDIVA
jgi:hypothetical protein